MTNLRNKYFISHKTTVERGRISLLLTGRVNYERKEITLLADLADIDSKMADIDLQLNRPGEGEGLSADVVQDPLDDSSEEE